MKISPANVDRLIRLAAMLAAAVGTLCAAPTIWTFTRLLMNALTLTEAALTLLTMLLLLLPAGWLISLGWQARRGVNDALIVQVAFFMTIILIVPPYTLLSRLMPLVLPKDSAEPLALFPGLVAVVMVGVTTTRWLRRRSSLADTSHRPIPRTLIAFVCFVGWAVASQLLPPVTNTALLLPLEVIAAVVAWFIYRVIIHYTESLPGLPFIGPYLHHLRTDRLTKVHEKRIAQYQCPQCAYELRQSLHDHRDVCPECGFELATVRFPELKTSL